MFQLDTPEKFRAAWPFLTQKQKDDYVAQGILRTEPEATTNQQTTGNDYSGAVALRRVYMFGTGWGVENVVSPQGEGWETLTISPATAREVAILIAQREPSVVEKLMEQNGGVMPNFLPPLEKPVPVQAEEVSPDSVSGQSADNQ